MDKYKVVYIVGFLFIFFGIIFGLYEASEWNPFVPNYYPPGHEKAGELYFSNELVKTRPLLTLGYFFVYIGINIFVASMSHYFGANSIQKRGELWTKMQ